MGQQREAQVRMPDRAAERSAGGVLRFVVLAVGVLAPWPSAGRRCTRGERAMRAQEWGL
jgi:hypothetical protein